MDFTVKVPSNADRHAVLGPAERNLKMLRETLGVSVVAREGRVAVSGDAAAVAISRRVLDSIIAQAVQRSPLTRQQVLDLISIESDRVNEPGPGGWESHANGHSVQDWDGRLNVYAAGKPVRAKTPNQQAYLDAIRDNDLVFAIGPAGTGKTYLAVAAAVHLLRSDRVRRLVLVRPAVEAGERLGFLPGDLREKVNPYLRPLFDALNDMMDYPTLRRFMESDVIEVAPLAFMRGRTLNNAVIICDEAQNTTRGQMKMFLTRMGHGSKMIVTGDVTQIDLPENEPSGLIDAARRLRRTPGVAFIGFEKADVVRHSLVQRVIDAYGEDADESPSTHRTRTRKPPRANAASTDNPRSGSVE